MAGQPTSVHDDYLSDLSDKVDTIDQRTMRIAASLGNLREEVAGNRQGIAGSQQGLVGLRAEVADIAKNQDQLSLELGKVADVLAQILKSLEAYSIWCSSIRSSATLSAMRSFLQGGTL